MPLIFFFFCCGDVLRWLLRSGASAEASNSSRVSFIYDQYHAPMQESSEMPPVCVTARHE